MFDRTRRALSHRHDPVIRPHIGQVIERRLLLGGRVLREGALSPATATTPRWRNLINTYRSFVHAKIAGATLVATFGEAKTEVRSDSEGYFSVEMDLPGPIAGPLWQEVEFRLLHAQGYSGPPVTAKGLVLVHPSKSRFAVISDIDDTVLSSDVTSKMRMVLKVLLSNAHTRMPLVGVGALYRALERGRGEEHNPVFYVSNGPWNLHDVLVEFFRLNDIPLGPIMLRDFGAHLFLSRKPTGTHKRHQIGRILDFFPQVPVVMIGDSGEHDPEIFAAIAREFPGRVDTIYIRCVNSDVRRRQEIQRISDELRSLKVDLLLIADSRAAAVHAAGKGWIPTHAIGEIGNVDGATA